MSKAFADCVPTLDCSLLVPADEALKLRVGASDSGTRFRIYKVPFRGVQAVELSEGSIRAAVVSAVEIRIGVIGVQ
jgi:hypothetical protein